MRLLFLIPVIFLAACTSPPQAPINPVVEVQEPEFEIISIAIIRGELINTQFEAVLKIDNPNIFPVELSSLKYELYGNGLFWADGLENDILNIPAQSSKEAKFRFSMNFINMNRRILDDVIAMRQVQYRFRGNAQVRAALPRLSPFTMNYDISGLSEVKPTAD